MAALELQCPPPSHQHTPAHTPFHCENDDAAPLFLSPGRRRPARSIPRAPRCAPAAALRRHQMPGRTQERAQRLAPLSPPSFPPLLAQHHPLVAFAPIASYIHTTKAGAAAGAPWAGQRPARRMLSWRVAEAPFSLVLIGRRPFALPLSNSSPQQRSPGRPAGTPHNCSPLSAPSPRCGELQRPGPPPPEKPPALLVGRARPRGVARTRARARSPSRQKAALFLARWAVLVATLLLWPPIPHAPFFVGLFLLSFFSLLPSLSLSFSLPRVSRARRPYLGPPSVRCSTQALAHLLARELLCFRSPRASRCCRRLPSRWRGGEGARVNNQSQ